MPDLPITVRTADRRVRVTLRLTRPLPWAAVRPAVCTAAGLDAGTTLHHGIGAVPDNWVVGEPPLVAGCEVATEPDDAAPVRPPVVLAVLAGPDAGRWAALGAAPIRVGRDPASELRLADPTVSYRHAVIEPAATGLVVRDLGSTNGVIVDGTAGAGRAPAGTGSVLRLGNTVLQLQLTAQASGGFRPDGAGHLCRAARGSRMTPPLPAVPPRPVAPTPPTRRSLPVVSVLAGAAVGGALAILLRNPMFLAFTALGPLTMIATAVGDRARGRRSIRRERAEHRAADRAWRAAADDAARAARRGWWATWPGPAELRWRAQAAGGGLWQRARGDPTYRVLAVGVGTGRLPIVGAAGGSGDAAAVAVRDVPLTAPLRGTITTHGRPGRGLARWMIAQLVCLHSPADVALLVRDAREDLLPCADLPHAIHPPADATLEDLVSVAAGRDLVVVLDGAAAIASRLGRAVIAASGDAPAGTGGARADVPGHDHGRPVTSVCLVDAEPIRPTDRAPAGVAPGTTRADAARGGPAAPTTIGADLLAEICRALAPLREGDRPATVPTEIALTALTGPLDETALRARWRTPALRAMLGAGPRGAVTVDLAADGPHLLIAGTTGSGKSELLQTLIVSLAAAGPPDFVTFLLVDYKGGAAFEQIVDLPHVVGVLTDLDPAESERATAGLRAELVRRERLAATAPPGAAGPAGRGLPHLVVVIDEFATLAVELPAFLAGVLDIAQRGRSLGLHLVLATQRPAGVVTPAMRANISTRICLRVTDATDSIDVIGSPDAALLPARLPGRAIVAAGNAREEFQTALVSCPAPPDIEVVAHGAAAPPAVGGDPPTVLQGLVAAAGAAAAGRPAVHRPWLPPLPAEFVAGEAHPYCLALADLPDLQDRRLLDAPQDSTLVTGPPGSGRSAALRRMALVAARRGSELIVIDGSGDLADLRRWPAVTSYLDLTDPDLVRRAVQVLADPSRRPRDGHLRQVIVDHYDLVAAELDRTDHLAGAALLTELCARGGHTVSVAAGAPVAVVHQRAAAAFRTLIRLGDPDGGRTAPGRGRWGDVEVQLAACPGGCAPTAGVAPPPTAAPAGGPGVDTAGFTDPVVVRPLPRSVRAADLPIGDPAGVPIGLGGDAARPLAIDLTGPGGAIIVAGPPRSGVSATLDLIAARAAAAGVPVVVLRGATRPLAGEDGPAGVEVVRIGHDPEPLRARLAAHTGPLLLVADHGGADDHPAAALLARFLAVCTDGQHLVIGVRTGILLRARRGHLRDAIASRRCVLLQPNRSDGYLFDVTLPHRRTTIPGRGAWVDGTDVTSVQIAHL